VVAAAPRAQAEQPARVDLVVPAAALVSLARADLAVDLVDLAVDLVDLPVDLVDRAADVVVRAALRARVVAGVAGGAAVARVVRAEVTPPGADVAAAAQPIPGEFVKCLSAKGSTICRCLVRSSAI
jgi:hypothetical protein